MKEESKGRKLALWGAWLQLGPVFGLLGTVYGMIQAFANLAEAGAPQGGELAGNISIALWTTAIGLIPATIGLVLFGIALFVKKYRAPWFFKFLIVYSIFILIHFPVGTILGGVILGTVLSRREEFNRAQNPGLEEKHL